VLVVLAGRSYSSAVAAVACVLAAFMLCWRCWRVGRTRRRWRWRVCSSGVRAVLAVLAGRSYSSAVALVVACVLVLARSFL
jgi:hypothetical protein